VTFQLFVFHVLWRSRAPVRATDTLISSISGAPD